MQIDAYHSQVAVGIDPNPIHCLQAINGVLQQRIYRFVNYGRDRTPAQERRSCLRFRLNDQVREVAFGVDSLGVETVWNVPRVSATMWLGLSCSLNPMAHLGHLLARFPINAVPTRRQITAQVGNGPFALHTYYYIDAGENVGLDWLIDNDGNGFLDHVTIAPGRSRFPAQLNDAGDYVHVNALDALPWNRAGEVLVLRAEADWPPRYFDDEDKWKKVTVYLNRILAEGQPDVFHKVWRIHEAVVNNESVAKTVPFMLDVFRIFLADSDPNDDLSDGYFAASILKQEFNNLAR